MHSFAWPSLQHVSRGHKAPSLSMYNIQICWDVSQKQQHTYNALWEMLLMTENPLSLAIDMVQLKTDVTGHI